MSDCTQDETSRTNFGVLLNQMNPDHKSLVRNIERIDKKIVNASNGVKFLQTCINEDLLPKFTDIYIYIIYITIPQLTKKFFQ